jgi:hypothetical protein
MKTTILIAIAGLLLTTLAACAAIVALLIERRRLKAKIAALYDMPRMLRIAPLANCLHHARSSGL